MGVSEGGTAGTQGASEGAGRSRGPGEMGGWPGRRAHAGARTCVRGVPEGREQTLCPPAPLPSLSCFGQTLVASFLLVELDLSFQPSFDVTPVPLGGGGETLSVVTEVCAPSGARRPRKLVWAVFVGLGS